MGWDTRITLLVEGVGHEQAAVATHMAENDVRPFGILHTACFLALDHHQAGGVVYISYERRKYLPHWVIQELSVQYPFLYFTALGSCPEFDSGPAGLIKIVGGELVDSYGFWEERQAVLENPDPDVIYAWFGRGGPEERLRNLRVDTHPNRWIDERYYDNIIEFSGEEERGLAQLRRRYSTPQAKPHWRPIPLI